MPKISKNIPRDQPLQTKDEATPNPFFAEAEDYATSSVQATVPSKLLGESVLNKLLPEPPAPAPEPTPDAPPAKEKKVRIKKEKAVEVKDLGKNEPAAAAPAPVVTGAGTPEDPFVCLPPPSNPAVDLSPEELVKFQQAGCPILIPLELAAALIEAERKNARHKETVAGFVLGVSALYLVNEFAFRIFQYV